MSGRASRVFRSVVRKESRPLLIAGGSGFARAGLCTATRRTCEVYASIGEGQLFALSRLAGIHEMPRIALRHSGRAHGPAGAIQSARFTLEFLRAAVLLLLVGPPLAGIELVQEITFASADHSLSQLDVAAGPAGAGVEGKDRLIARGGFLKRGLLGVPVISRHGTYVRLVGLRCARRDAHEQQEGRKRQKNANQHRCYSIRWPLEQSGAGVAWCLHRTRCEQTSASKQFITTASNRADWRSRAFPARNGANLSACSCPPAVPVSAQRTPAEVSVAFRRRPSRQPPVRLLAGTSSPLPWSTDHTLHQHLMRDRRHEAR